MEKEIQKDIAIIKITTQLTLKDFKNYNFYSLFRKKSFIILAIIGGFIILNSVLALFSDAPRINDILTSFVLGFILIGLAPTAILMFSKRNFLSNKDLGAPIDYEFEEQFVSSANTHAQTKAPWNTLFKVEVTKNWLILYRSSQTANIVPRRYLSEEQIGMIKQFVLTNKVKANFKK